MDALSSIPAPHGQACPLPGQRRPSPLLRAVHRSPRIVAVLTVLFLASVSQAEPDYLKDIKPLLQKRCYACHGGLKQKAGLRLDTAERIRKGTGQHSILATGGTEEGSLIRRLTSSDPEERMPPEGDPLTPEQISLLKEWARLGAPFSGEERPDADPREHWAFRPPMRPPVPKPRTGGPARNPIDAFLAAERESRALEPVGVASPEVLLRRVFLDLTGLPPTREDLHAFLSDHSESAYERVVDRLLESPQYGERWARHWMDIWRYADWFGRRHVPDVWNSAPQIYRWRDWIVTSLNADKGYDRMGTEMLAADEVCPEDEAAGVATGYLVRNWYALNPNQWMRENVEHTAKAFLGLTLNCAHCHDHKYDPISQKEYFQFRAIFEPLGLRQDRWKGEDDPGPFQKYEYSTVRRVVKTGSVRVLDENLEAKTRMYRGGDERNMDTNSPPVIPGVPAMLGGSFQVKPVVLPPDAYYPGFRDFAQSAEVASRRAALDAARSNMAAIDRELGRRDSRPTADEGLAGSVRDGALARQLTTELARKRTEARRATLEADLESIQARIAADRSKYGGAPQATFEARASEASQAERRHAVRMAEEKQVAAEIALDLLKTEQALAGERRLAQGTPEKTAKDEAGKEAEALKKATDERDRAAKTLETSRTALATNSLAYTPLSPVYPNTSTGRRQALAHWLFNRENPLAARVAVNHIWMRHFRVPLVRTVFDFGRNGTPPTHPALLDWLSVEFMESGWSMKHLHRLMVTSQTYRLASAAAPSTAAAQHDPDNVYYWRMNPGQMESEVVRDSLLLLSGELDPTPGGYPVANSEAETSRRRTLYLECFPEEGGHSEFSGMFDPPDPSDCYRRSTTVLPQQALALSNSPISREQSAALARRLSARLTSGGNPGPIEPSRFVEAAFEQILGRRPSGPEASASRIFLERLEAESPGDCTVSEKARESLVLVLFNHHDFVTVR